MAKRSRSDQIKRRRERSSRGEMGDQTPSPVARVDAPGTLSLAVSLVVALVILAIVVMANVLLRQPATGDGTAATPAVPAMTTSEGRSDQ